MHSFVTKLTLTTLLLWAGLATLANAQTTNIDIPYSTTTAPMIISAAASYYGADGDSLLRTAKCESGLKNVPKHWDVNGYAYGNFQFHIKTFYNNAKEMGLENADITDPIQQSQVAAYMFSKGRQSQWTCFSRLNSP